MIYWFVFKGLAQQKTGRFSRPVFKYINYYLYTKNWSVEAGKVKETKVKLLFLDKIQHTT